MARRQPMTLIEYWHTIGTDNAQAVAANAQTSWEYFKLVAYRQKPLGARLAQRIIEAASLHTPGFQPDLRLILQPLSEQQDYRVTPVYGRYRKLLPTSSFRRSMSAKKAA